MFSYIVVYDMHNTSSSYKPLLDKNAHIMRILKFCARVNELQHGRRSALIRKYILLNGF